ncbi:MAG: hypothetical protein Q9214_003147, partial [Letrouitia sp. 1 TL-2023]
MDLIIKIWRKLATNQFIEYSREILSVPGHTVSVPVLNMPLIVTEDTENIKAVMSTQVSKIRPTDAAVLNRCMNNLLRHLSNEGQPCDMYDLIDRYVLDVVSEIFLGESADSLLSEKQPFRDNMEALVRWNTAKTVLGPLGALVPDFPVRKSLKAINAYMDIYVQRTLSLSEEELKAKPEKYQTLADSLAVQRASPK